MLSVSIGTVIWTTIAFLVVMFLMKKMAWGPIMESIKEREDFIESSIADAKKAKEDLATLKSKNEDLLKEARAERDLLMKDAKAAKEKMISEATGEAKIQAEKIMIDAKASIDHEKSQAIAEIKTQVATLSIDIAEKIVKEKLSLDEKQQELVKSLVNNINLN